MKREQALAVIRFAGYHGDYDKFIRTYVENRVSYAIAKSEFSKGIKQKESGMKCGCSDCSKSHL